MAEPAGDEMTTFTAGFFCTGLASPRHVVPLPTGGPVGPLALVKIDVHDMDYIHTVLYCTYNTDDILPYILHTHRNHRLLLFFVFFFSLPFLISSYV
jgi:hypothetical protein